MGSTTKLNDIIAGKDKYKVFGRLIRIWDARYITTNTLLSIDGILLDDNGSTAQITIPKNLEKQFRPHLAEDNVYIISGLNAIPRNNKSYTYDYQNYILQFTSTTTINHLQSKGADIPHHQFTFCSFDELPKKCLQNRPLIDLIGIISDIGPFEFAGPKSQKKNRKIQLRNLDTQEQQVVLWEHQGENFDEKTIIEKSKQGVVVGIFAGLTASKFAGKYEASSSSATRVYIDLDYAETATYQAYQWGAPKLQQRIPDTLQKDPMKSTDKLHNLQEILNLPDESFQKGKTYSCIAEVISINESTNWYYKACKKCKMGYSILSGTPRCGCPYPVQSPEFKLPLTIKDDSASLDCIAFYTVAEDLIECSAVQASQNMQIEPDNHPPILQTAVGNKRIFHIGISNNVSSKYPVRYVLKRSFKIDTQETIKDTISEQEKNNTLPEAEPESATTGTPPSENAAEANKDHASISNAKRKLNLNEEEPSDPAGKQKKIQIDDNI